MKQGYKTMKKHDPNSEYCQRCDKKLAPNKIVWLELDNTTGFYTDKPLPEGHISQGGFAFGPDCAKIVLADQDPDFVPSGGDRARDMKESS